MNIIYLGHSSFRIKGNNKTVVCDPFDKTVGFLMQKTNADVVTVSHDHHDHSALARVEGDPFVVRGPGEYEIGGIHIYGLVSYHDGKKGEERGKNTAYVFQEDGFRLCHLGDLGTMLTDKQIEEIDGIDVLFLPVGGFYTLDPKQAIELVEKIDPKIVIPMHFKTTRHSSDFDKLIAVDEFVKLWGREAQTLDKLNLKQTTLGDETQLIILEEKS